MSCEHTLIVGATENLAVSLRPSLGSDESALDNENLSVTSTDGLTINSESVSTEATVINDVSVPAGQVLNFSVTATEAATCTITMKYDTDSTPAQYQIRRIEVEVID